MSVQAVETTDRSALDDREVFARGLRARKTRGRVWQTFFGLSLVVGLLALLALFANIANSAFGYVILTYERQPEEISPDVPLEELDAAGLAQILAEYSRSRLPVYIRDNLSGVTGTEFTTLPIRELLAGRIYPEEVADLTIRELTPEQLTEILGANVPANDLRAIIATDVTGTIIVSTYTLTESLFERDRIQEIYQEAPRGTDLVFKSWISWDFLTSTANSNAYYSGIRTAILGTLWVVGITILVSFPIGLGAAIYLEEYATEMRHNRLLMQINSVIETNIRNLAGVPSIIYGLLGLAMFVRILEAFTQGRTILAASLTMALLILPIIIINAQEALRAVPSSIREASLGLGATKWQTIWRQVLPAALPGILTGTILALSRAIGETAPLIVIGAATFIQFDPTSPFAKFTVLPIQIYSWTSRPQQEFRSVASAAIIVLLILLMLLNATAIILRQRFRKNLTA